MITALTFWSGVLALKLVVMNSLVFVYGAKRDGYILCGSTGLSILLFLICKTYGL